MPTSYSPAEWLKLQQIFDSAIEFAPGERKRYIEEICADSPTLRKQIEAMLATFESGNYTSDVVERIAFSAAMAELPAIGARIGPYRILETIGHGGMGIVYRAVRDDDEYRKEVAIKVAAAGRLTPELRQRFLSERQILANLDHPNIARLLDGGTTADGIPYVVMEFVDGKPIDQYCRETRAETGIGLDLRQRVALMVQVARAVDDAHRHLVVHRDLKPDNIHVTSDGTPKLLDFGIAKALDPETANVSGSLTLDASRLMTPDYASPEQVRGNAITTATDVYQIGVLLYILLTDRRPFQKDPKSGMGEMERLICEVPPPKPNIHRDLDHILLHAMEKDPKRRYTSAGELADDLERYLNGFPVNAQAASRSYRAWKFVLRNKFAVSASAMLLLLLIGFTIALAVQVNRVQHERDAVRRERDATEKIAEFLTMIFSAPDPSLARGRTLTARDLLDQGVDHIEKQGIADLAIRDRLLVTLGKSYQSLGIYDRATSLFEMSLQIRERIYGSHSKEVAEALGNLADVYLEHEDYEKMEAILPRWQQLAVSLTGEESEASSDAFSMVAADKIRNGDLIRAEQTQQKVVDIARKLHGVNSREAFRSYLFLCYIQFYRGKNQQVEEAYRTFLSTMQKGDWKNSESVVQILDIQGKLGYVLTLEGRYREAEPLLRQALDMSRKIVGPHHKLFANLEVDMGFLDASIGRFSEAEWLLKDAISIHTKLLGEDSLFVGGSLDELARVYLYQGRYREAEPLLYRSLENMTKRTGAHGPGKHGESAHMARVLFHLGQAQFGQKKLDAAEQSFRQALNYEIEFNGDDSLYAADDHVAIGEVLQAQGKLPEAELEMRKALTIYRTFASDCSPGFTTTLERLGSLLAVEHREVEASPLLAEAVAIRKKIVFPDATVRR